MTRVWIGGFSRLSAAALPFTMKTFYSHFSGCLHLLGWARWSRQGWPMLPTVPTVTTCPWFCLSQACLAWQRRGRLGQGVFEAHQCQVTRDQAADRGLCHPASRPEDDSGAAVQPVPKGLLSSMHSDSISLSPSSMLHSGSTTAMRDRASHGSDGDSRGYVACWSF